jgi:hypothetical protein
MRLYPHDPRPRLAHAGADLGMLAWAVLWVLVARAVHGAVLVLAALPPGTGAGWRAGDPVAVRALAALELNRLGLRPPPDGPVGAALPGRSVGVDGPQPR